MTQGCDANTKLKGHGIHLSLTAGPEVVGGVVMFNSHPLLKCSESL